MNAKEYLTWIEEWNPEQGFLNFWMSEEYINKKELVWSRNGDLAGWKESPTSEEWFFPPTTPDGLFYYNNNIFTGMSLSFSCSPYSEFLDYQFIYNPKDFLEMKGHKWATFRKNIKKYPQRTKGLLVYDNLDSHEEKQIENLILCWGEKKGDTIHDPELLIKYAMEGENRKGLYCNEELVGINIWDENFQYINYRYCIDNGEPFLNEYLRYLFYTDSEIQNKNKLVNDGGALGSEGLKKFKEKLNPVSILKVYSYKGT